MLLIQWREREINRAREREKERERKREGEIEMCLSGDGILRRLPGGAGCRGWAISGAVKWRRVHTVPPASCETNGV